MFIMNVIIGIGLVIAILLAVAINGRTRERRLRAIQRRFLDDEAAANNVRKKDLGPELFYEADFTVLPPLPPGDPYEVERCAARKMIRFEEHVTNLELKQRYGLAQLDLIAQYEENFTLYQKALTDWGAALVEEGNKARALTVLGEAITLGSQYRDTYKLVADIYADRGDSESLEALIDYATQTHFDDPAMRVHIHAYINRKLEEIYV